jgi:membrane associated rhomboid family serine protease
MDQLVAALQSIIVAIKSNAWFVFKLLLFLWAFTFINFLLGYRLNYLGIYPRSFRGLFGIIFSPILHQNFGHLFYNSIPFFLLASLILAEGRVTFYYVTTFVILFGGLGIWLFGRRAIHIGASTLVMGYFGYLLANAYYHFSMSAILLALICLYYFSGLFLSLIPGKKGVSLEGHISGFVAGIASSYLLPTVARLLMNA